MAVEEFRKTSEAIWFAWQVTILEEVLSRMRLCLWCASMVVWLLDTMIGVIKGPKSWLIAKSITISRVVNQSKVNPQQPKGVLD